ncbi:MAG TPA: ligase-associated DNA damage response exonuclease [Cyclobacteriaceae bacterium]|nr:ligase-associated DNA damage response exonuclease [Cyclobacteriaceae bacterium]
MPSQLLQFTSSGIFCPDANVYIDPWKPVDKAIITHAHSDHARFGNKHYLAHKDSESILRLRLGDDISLETMAYGESFTINNIKFSLHPAGHIIGSAQVRVERDGEIWVAAGDYKIQDDNVSVPFEVVKCNTFITESTFGLPIYKWPVQKVVMGEILEWWKENQVQGKASVLMGYALGKMQRLIVNLQPFPGPVFAHGAVFNVNQRLREAGFDLPFIAFAGDVEKKLFRDALILAPPSAASSPWLKRFEPYSTGYCSGWMAVRGAKAWRAIDRGFVLSDHADWNDLNATIAETGAERIFVTHGFTDTYARWLNEKGIEAHEVKTEYGDETEETTAETIG